jgi:nucleoside transporter
MRRARLAGRRPMSRSLRIRLSVLLFLQYFVPGAIMPILSHYLINTLGFDAFQAGKVVAVPAVAALVAPFVAAHMADRWISAERLLGLCHLVGAVVMLALAQVTEYRMFLTIYLVYSVLFAPTFGLSNAVAFHHLGAERSRFGSIRVWGTAGWVAVAWLFGLVWLRLGGDLRHALLLSAISSLVLGVYAFTLPRGHVQITGKPLPSLGQAMGVFRNRRLAVFSGLTLLAAMVDRFYYFGTGPFLSHLGFSDKAIMPAMSIGQVSEIVAMQLLGFLLLRWGTRTVLAAGILLEAFRYTVFAIGGPMPLIYLALATHGFCYTFYFTTSIICVDTMCPPANRSGVQQLFGMIITGGGVLGGSLLAGKLGQWFLEPALGPPSYASFWMVPAGLAILVAIMVYLFYHDEPAQPAADA